ncbi:MULTISPECIES: Spy/CpxP family protein refolding chaperone [unclassified Thiocapsa]|uniref:Spy/CpxP family protein refolding chaperone n=1 Tax=unclassified Thiocapsa TaxID=2641286 RepID=UPI0035AE4645
MNTGKSFRTATLAFAVMAVMASTSVLAGPRGYEQDPSACADQRIERMTKSLDLTAEQQSEILTILEGQRAHALQQRKEVQARIGAVLTPEQQARIQEQRDARMERHLDRLADRLDLSEEQVDQVRTVMQTKNDNSGMARGEIREQIKAVMTEDQLKRFESRGPGSKRGGPGEPCAEGKTRGGPAF